jgi:hypothetical protein
LYQLQSDDDIDALALAYPVAAILGLELDDGSAGGLRKERNSRRSE